MKLIRLSNLRTYKNIPIGYFDFGSGHYTALVGTNGSGKSNWIELIAKVILHLIEGDEPEEFYRLSLENNGLVEYTASGLKCSRNGLEVTKDDLGLPKKLLVCYSGEEERLWKDILFESYARYFGAKEINQVNVPPAMYINRYHWAIAMIVLMCSDKPEVKQFCEELWGTGIQPNQIKVDIDIAPDMKGYKDPNTQRLLQMIRDESQGELGLHVSQFKTFTIPPGGQSNEDKCRLLYYLLYALSMPVIDKEGKIQIGKAITRINLKGTDDVELASLSEGHKKRILVMLMTRILGDEQTVYLYDEPDAHVDVMTKCKIMELICDAPGHAVLTTHSPVMTRHMDADSVRRVDNGEAVTAAWGSIFKQLAGTEIANINSFLFSLNKKIVITEGPNDIRYIHQAASKLKDAYPDIEIVATVPSYCLNGAGAVDYFLEHTLDPIVAYFDKILFVFDRDDAGINAKDKVNTYIADKGLAAKISVLCYADDYVHEPAHEFLVEDFFPSSCYSGRGDVPNITLTGAPAYYELKKFDDVQAKVKGYIGAHYNDADFDATVYAKFLPLLRKIVEKLDL